MMVAPESKQTSDNSKSLEEGLDFILRHFEEPIWPRTISTNVTGGRQILTYSKPQALARFKQANLLDCRINAYPDYTGFGGLNRQGPNFIFIDLDRSNFKTEKSYKLALEATLQNIKEKLSESNPTVLWSGNGYHIYQPTKAFPLEQVDKFSRSGGNKFDQQQLQPSIAFLRFAEQYLSNNKSDPLHNPSFKSCMIRIPGSYNSKCEGCSSSEIKIIQMWNGYRPKINLLLGSFHAYLVDQNLNDITQQKKELKKHYHQKHNSGNRNYIPWIEKLLQTPISDHRKFISHWVLSRYLTNVIRLNLDESYTIIKYWSTKCNELKPLLPSIRDFDKRIRDDIIQAVKSGKGPIGKNLLNEMNNELYVTLFSSEK